MIRQLLGALGLGVALAAPALAAPSPPAPADLPVLKAHGELRIGADPTAGEPYYWLAGNMPSGFEADLGRAVARKLGVKATFVTTSWRDLVPAVKAGKIDVALNALEVRNDPELRFSKPYYTASQAILVRSTETKIYALKDLAGRRVATTDGSVAAAVMGDLKPAVQLRLFADTQAPFKDLLEGKADAVVLESAMVRRKLATDPKHLKLAGLPFVPRPYGAAMRKNAPLLGAAFDKALAELRASGELTKILTTYNLMDSLQGAGASAPKPKPSASPAPSRHRRRRHRVRHAAPSPVAH